MFHHSEVRVDGSELGTATVGRAVLTKQLQLRLCRLLNVPVKHTGKGRDIGGVSSKQGAVYFVWYFYCLITFHYLQLVVNVFQNKNS